MLKTARKSTANTTKNGHHDVEEVHDVESIVGTKAVSRKRFYLIKWVADDAYVSSRVSFSLLPEDFTEKVF